MVEDALRLRPYGVFVVFHVPAQLALGPLGVELRVLLGHLDDVVVALDGRVVWSARP